MPVGNTATKMTYFSSNGGENWTKLPEMATARMLFAMAVDNDEKKVYVAGGQTARGIFHRTAEAPPAASCPTRPPPLFSSYRHPRAIRV